MNEFFKGILNGINSLLGNYGWSIVVFTVLVRLVLMPFDYKSRVGMRRMQKLQPEMNRLQKKYANDKERMNLKLSELYKKEKVNPLSSCLPMLLTFPLLIIMFNAMRDVANEQLVKQTFDILLGNEPKLESWLWIKNLWMPDSPFAAAWPDLNSLQMIPANIWQRMFVTLSETDVAYLAENFSITADTFLASDMRAQVQTIFTAMSSLPGYTEHVSPLPGFTFNMLLFQFSVMRNYNGWFLLPILSAVSQYLLTAMQPAQPAGDSAQAQSAQSTNNFMKWFFPIFTLFLCFSYTASFALYWVVGNLIAIVQNFVINKYLDKKDAEAAALGEGSVK